MIHDKSRISEGGKNIGNKILIKILLFFLTIPALIAKVLNHFIKLRPMKVERYGKSFFVSGNPKYFFFWKNKSWERNTHKIFDKFLDSNHSYIDIGAWIGPTVLYGAQIAKKVYAIEPDPIAFKELEKNGILSKLIGNVVNDIPLNRVTLKSDILFSHTQIHSYQYSFLHFSICPGKYTSSNKQPSS